jgi:hypothetical protein
MAETRLFNGIDRLNPEAKPVLDDKIELDLA